MRGFLNRTITPSLRELGQRRRKAREAEIEKDTHKRETKLNASSGALSDVYVEHIPHVASSEALPRLPSSRFAREGIYNRTYYFMKKFMYQ